MESATILMPPKPPSDWPCTLSVLRVWLSYCRIIIYCYYHCFRWVWCCCAVPTGILSFAIISGKGEIVLLYFNCLLISCDCLYSDCFFFNYLSVRDGRRIRDDENILTMQLFLRTLKTHHPD